MSISITMSETYNINSKSAKPLSILKANGINSKGNKIPGNILENHVRRCSRPHSLQTNGLYDHRVAL